MNLCDDCDFEEKAVDFRCLTQVGESHMNMSNIKEPACTVQSAQWFRGFVKEIADPKMFTKLILPIWNLTSFGLLRGLNH